jgi:hypothetical protein
MFNNLLSLDAEFIIFIIIEIVLIIGYFVFFKFSRNHGGAFDRRIEERRSNAYSGKWTAADRRVINIGFRKTNVELARTNEIFEVDTERRMSERRMFNDRRTA